MAGLVGDGAVGRASSVGVGDEPGAAAVGALVLGVEAGTGDPCWMSAVVMASRVVTLIAISWSMGGTAGGDDEVDHG